MTEQDQKLLQKRQCPLKQMFPGKRCLWIFWIITRLTPLRRSQSTDSPSNGFGAKSKPLSCEHLYSGNTYMLIYKARVTGTQQKCPSLSDLSWCTVSIIKPHFFYFNCAPKATLLLHSDNKWLHQAYKTQMSFGTGSFKPPSIFTTAQLDKRCSTLARTLIEAKACAWQPWHRGWRARMKNYLLLCVGYQGPSWEGHLSRRPASPSAGGSTSFTLRFPSKCWHSPHPTHPPSP